MNDPRLRSLLWSGSLILGGVVLLLFNLGVLADYGPWPLVILAAGCGAAAAGFFIGFARNHQEWWRLLPAWTLTALATMLLTSLAAGVDRALIAAQVFAGLALAFGHIYLPARRERWWAILPGGFMFVLAVVVGVSPWVTSTQLLAAGLFVGLALVFFLLYLLDEKRRQWWALIPGSVLLVFGLLAFSAGRMDETPLLRWWPVVLIVAGLLVPLLARRTPPAADKFQVNHAPRPRPTTTAPAQTAPGKPGSGKPASGKPAPGAATVAPRPRPALGEYTQPAPGASVEILDPDE